MMDGEEWKVTLDDNVVLDFGGLLSAETTEQVPSQRRTETRRDVLTSDKCDTSSWHENNAERLETSQNGIAQENPPEQAKILLLKTRREREDHQRSLEVYRTYQENIRQGEQLQTDILGGVRAGEDIYSLFLKAVKAISHMTSNPAFYDQIEKDTRSIYGRGLNYKPPLQNELQDAQERLQRLTEAERAETQPDSRERIRRAITAHREHIAELEKQIAKAQEKPRL